MVDLAYVESFCHKKFRPMIIPIYNTRFPIKALVL